MKVAHNTPDQLILDDRPWLLGGLLVLLILIFAGFGLQALLAGRGAGLLGLAGAALWGVALVVFVRRTTVTFDRGAGQITRHVKSLRRATTTLWPLSGVSKADIETRLSRNSGKHGKGRVTPMHRPVLHWTDGSPATPLMEVYVNGDGASETAAAINRWLQSSRPSTG